MTSKTYQEIFNDKLKLIRLLCNASGNASFGDSIIKVMFDLSDELKDNQLIKDGDTNNENISMEE